MGIVLLDKHFRCARIKKAVKMACGMTTEDLQKEDVDAVSITWELVYLLSTKDLLELLEKDYLTF